jgi:hypothetical protein
MCDFPIVYAYSVSSRQPAAAEANKLIDRERLRVYGLMTDLSRADRSCRVRRTGVLVFKTSKTIQITRWDCWPKGKLVAMAISRSDRECSHHTLQVFQECSFHSPCIPFHAGCSCYQTNARGLFT